MKHYWNPWHGCTKVSEGCQNCYVFAFDRQYQKDAGEVHLVKTKFSLPIKKKRNGSYLIDPGSEVATCFTSDFFHQQADCWRQEIWQMIRQRSDCLFFIITKRPERIADCLPCDWENGYDNVFLNCTVENQAMAEKRLPIFLNLPLKIYGITVAPILEAVDLRFFFKTNKVDFVSVGGESYAKARVTDFNHVLFVRQQCEEYKVNFSFHQTGSKLLKDGHLYHIAHKKEYEQAKKAGLDLLYNKLWNPQ